MEVIPVRDVARVNPQVPAASALLSFRRAWRGLAGAAGGLLLFPLLAHVFLTDSRLLVRGGCFFAQPRRNRCPSFEGGFGVCVLVWHGQATSDLASSKHRPIFILTLS